VRIGYLIAGCETDMNARTSAVKRPLFLLQIPRAWAINRPATTALAAVALFACISFGLSAVLLNELASARDWVLHSHAVRSRIDRVSWDFDALENGLRGFILTGAEAQRAAYERAKSQLPSDLDRLAAAHPNNPGQQGRAGELFELTNAQIRRMDRIMEARRAGSLETARDLAFAVDDHRIEELVNQIRGEEDQLLIARLAREQQDTMLVLAALIASGALAFGSVALAAHLLNQALRQRDRALKQREELLAQKDLLMREVDHRVRNSLSLIHGLLSLHQRQAATDERLRDQLGDAASRVLTVARVHEHLYRSGAVDRVEIASYVGELCEALAGSLLPAGASDAVRVRVTPGELKIAQAVSLGLIVAELVTNALKYAAPSSAAPVEVSLDVARSGLRLTVADHGPGLPSAFNLAGENGLGMQVVQLLVRQLQGRLDLERTGPGACFVITAPLPA
jgi:two-component sensor histidine kinase